MDNLLKIYAFIFGSLIGSFLNVVILRLPLGKDLVLARSACPQCGNQLKWFHNIPVISYLLLRGKCAFCGKPISWRYPLVELMTGVLALSLFPQVMTLTTLTYSLWYFFVGCIFICHFFIDLDHQLLLDKLNIYLLILFLGFVMIHHHYLSWMIGGIVGFGIPYLVTYLFYKFRGVVGLGGGDIKLYGILGLYLGVEGVVLNIFLSCLLGSLIGVGLILYKKQGRDVPMAFGPCILVVAFIQIFYPSYFVMVKSVLLP